MLRRLQESNEVDLLSILQIEIERGSESDSAYQSKLSFTAILTEYDAKSMGIKINFDNPLSVSIGDQPDVLWIKFVEPELFVSKETGKSIAPETDIKLSIPRQFPSESAY